MNVSLLSVEVIVILFISLTEFLLTCPRHCERNVEKGGHALIGSGRVTLAWLGSVVGAGKGKTAGRLISHRQHSMLIGKYTIIHLLNTTTTCRGVDPCNVRESKAHVGL